MAPWGEDPASSSRRDEEGVALSYVDEEQRRDRRRGPVQGVRTYAEEHSGCQRATAAFLAGGAVEDLGFIPAGSGGGAAASSVSK